MNETKRIDPSILDGKEPIAVGYKIFNYDWTGHGGYSYADENGNVEGSVHTVTGKLSKCGWGLHYCVNPVDCMKYRDIVQWNKFALVEAYEENIDCPGDRKSVCRTLRIKKVLTFDEMIEACREFAKDGGGVSDSSGVSDSFGIRYSSGISGSNGVRASNGISYSNGIRYSNGVRASSGVSASNGIRYSSGISKSMHCLKCEGISRCIFCIGLEGKKLRIFNKSVNARRFNEVWNELSPWCTDFTNAKELKDKYGNGEWARTPVTEIKVRDDSEAYAEMPPKLIEYIKAMPEYDEEIFNAITGGDK